MIIFSKLDNIALQSMSNNPEKTKGIDIQEALKILSVREKANKNAEEYRKFLEEASSKGNDTTASLKKRITGQGQVIDLFKKSSGDSGEEYRTQSTSDHIGEEESNDNVLKEQKQEGVGVGSGKQNLDKYTEVFKDMKHIDLLKTVLDIQKQRVKSYREYEEGLDIVLKNNSDSQIVGINLSPYLDACTQATAKFSVLSQSINAICEVLLEQSKSQQDKTKKEHYTQLRQLQAHEKEKLNLTAALHLERIRMHGHNNNIEVDKQDDRVSLLLSQGVTSLKQKLSLCIESINEILDEVRIYILEEDEEM